MIYITIYIIIMISISIPIGIQPIPPGITGYRALAFAPEAGKEPGHRRQKP